MYTASLFFQRAPAIGKPVSLPLLLSAAGIRSKNIKWVVLPSDFATSVQHTLILMLFTDKTPTSSNACIYWWNNNHDNYPITKWKVTFGEVCVCKDCFWYCLFKQRTALTHQHLRTKRLKRRFKEISQHIIKSGREKYRTCSPSLMIFTLRRWERIFRISQFYRFLFTLQSS